MRRKWIDGDEAAVEDGRRRERVAVGVAIGVAKLWEQACTELVISQFQSVWND
jgi:hypothetical protein